jgi:hypothetical protein
LTSICKSRCRAEIDAFQEANANPYTFTRTYVTRTNSPFFLNLDEGAVTPMTIIAITEISDCEYVCGQRLETDNPDKCVAIAGVIGFATDLTIMTYCIPSIPNAGVRRNDGNTWTVPGSINLMNSVIDCFFTDFERGESLVVLSSVESTDFQSRIDVFSKGDAYVNAQQTMPIVSHDDLLSAVAAASRIVRVNSIIVQPYYGDIVLHAEVDAVVITSGGGEGSSFLLSGIMDEFKESSSVEKFNICGTLVGKAWQISQQTTCSMDIWHEADRGHIIWIAYPMAAVVPGGSLLSTGTGDVRYELLCMKPLIASNIYVYSFFPFPSIFNENLFLSLSLSLSKP